MSSPPPPPPPNYWGTTPEQEFYTTQNILHTSTHFQTPHGSLFTQSFHKVTAPFLTVHGTSDGVTCPSGSKLLYEKAKSEDKALKLYEGMYHSLIQGELDESADLVLADMRAWIDERVDKYGPKCNGNGQ